MSWAVVDRRLAAVEAAARAHLADPLAPLSPIELTERLGIAPDPWQIGVLSADWQQSLWNCSRQSGKSTAAAALAVQRILFVPESLVLILAPSDRQAALLFKTTLRMYRALGGIVDATIENRRSLELANGSQVHALPGKEGTIRGFSGVDLLILDEASRVPDELYQAARPMLAVSGGRIAALSTPWGKRGWWYEAWVNGSPDWYRVETPATACPRISPAFLEQERRSLPRQVFEAEYLCQFHDTDDQVFGSADIERAITNDVTPLFGGDPVPAVDDTPRVRSFLL